MDIKEYMELSEKTLSSHFFAKTDKDFRVLHAVMGISWEAGELLDMYKKHIFYGKDLDLINLQEELGDIMWFIAILLREYDLDFHQLLDDNIQKLKKRYGEKFDQDKAINRDTDNELSHFTD